MLTANLPRRMVCEAIGTAFLIAAVVGSGIMGERLAAGNQAVMLLVNTLATGTALVALIYSFAHISGAHFNPVVTLALASRYSFGWGEVPAYIFAQLGGAMVGIAATHGMFGRPIFETAQNARGGAPQLLSEAIATFGLVLIMWASRRYRKEAVTLCIGAYIASAYWFTSSQSFANPAVTIARMTSNSYAGIRAIDVPGFILAQLVGAGLATLLARWLVPHRLLEEKKESE